MAFFKRRYEDFRVLLIAFLYIIPFTATFDTDCNGKSFHCVNSTHFKICVDVGGGVSMAVDNIVIECPTSTICQNINNFECEYQESTTRKEFIEKSEVTNDPVNLNVISLDHVDRQMSTLTEHEITSVLPLISPMSFSTTNQPSDINVTNVRSDAEPNIAKIDEMLTKELTNDNSKFETNNESEHIYDGNRNLKNNAQPPFMQAKSKLYQLQNNTSSKFDRPFVTTESVRLSDFNHNLYDMMNLKNDPTTITPVEQFSNNISNITDNVFEIEHKDDTPNEMKISSTRSTISGNLDMKSMLPEALPIKDHNSTLKSEIGNGIIKDISVNGENGNTEDTIIQTALENSFAHTTVSQNLKTENTFSDLATITSKKLGERQTEMANDTNNDDKISSLQVNPNTTTYINVQEAIKKNHNYDKYFLNNTLIEVLSNNTGLENSTDPNSNISDVDGRGNIRNNKSPLRRTELGNENANSTVLKYLKNGITLKEVPERPKPKSKKDGKSETEISNIPELENTTSQSLNLGVNGESGSTKNNKDIIIQIESQNSSDNSTLSQSLKTQNIFSEINDTTNPDAKFEAELATETNKVDDNYLLNIPLNKTIKTNIQKAIDSNPDSNKSFVYETSTEVLCNDTELECMSGQTLNFTVDRENGTTSNKKNPITQTESDKSSPNTRASHKFETDNKFPNLNIISGNHDAKLETGLLNDSNKSDNISLLNVTTNTTIYLNPQETRNKNPNFDKHLLNDTLIEVTSNNTGFENSTDPNSNLSVVDGSDNIRNNTGGGKQMELDNSYANLTASKSLKTENTFPERPKPNSNQDEKSETEIKHQINKNDSILSPTISSSLKINAKAPEAEEQENRTLTDVLSNTIELKNTTSQTLNLGVYGESGSTSNNKDIIIQTELEKSSDNSTVFRSLKTQKIFSERNDTSNRDAKFEAEIATGTNKVDDNYLLNIPQNKTIKPSVQIAIDSNPDSNKSLVYETSSRLLCNNTELKCVSGPSLNFTVDRENGTISNEKDPILTESDKSSPNTRASHNFETDNKFPNLNIISGNHDAKLETGLLNDSNKSDNISLLNVTTNTTIYLNPQETRNKNPNFDKHLLNDTLIEVTSNNTGFENSTDLYSNLSVVEGSDNIRNNKVGGKQIELDNSYANLTVSKSLKTENTFPERPNSNQDEKSETEIGHQINKDDSILSSHISSSLKINAKAPEAEEQENRTTTDVLSNIILSKNTTSQTLNLGVYGESGSTRKNKDTIIQTELEKSSDNSTVSQSLKTQNIFSEINDTSNLDAKFKVEIASGTNKVDDNYLFNIPLNKTIKTNVLKANDSNPDSNKSFVHETSTKVLCNDTELECMSGQTLNLTVDGENRTTNNKKDPITQMESDKLSPNTRASHNFGTDNMFPDSNIISSKHEAKLETRMLNDTNENNNISLLNVTTNTTTYVSAQETRNKNPNFNKHLPNDTLIEVTSNNTGLENSIDPNSNLSVVDESNSIRNNKSGVKQMELDNSYANLTVSKILKTENTFPERPKPSSNQDEKSETEIGHQINKDDNILSSTIPSSLKINEQTPGAVEQENRTPTDVLSNINQLKNKTIQTLNLGVYGESDSTRNNKDAIIQTELEKSFDNSTVSRSLKTQNIFSDINDTSNRDAKFEAEIATEINKVDYNYLLNIPLNKTIKPNVQKANDSNPDSNKSFVYETSTEVLCNDTKLECMSDQTINLTVDGENRTTGNKKDPITQMESDKSSPYTRASHNFWTGNMFPELNTNSGKHEAKLEIGMLNDTNENNNISLLNVTTNTTINVSAQAIRNNNPKFDKHLPNDTLIEVMSNNTGLENSIDPNSNLSVVEGSNRIRNNIGEVKQMELDNSYANLTVSKNLKTENTFPERPKPSSNQDEKSETEIGYQANKDDSILSSTISTNLKINTKAPEAEEKHPNSGKILLNRTPTEVVSNFTELKNTTSQTLNLGIFGESGSTRNNKDTIIQTELEKSSTNTTISQSLKTQNIVPEINDTSNPDAKFEADIATGTNKVDDNYLLNIPLNKTIKTNVQKANDSNPDSNKSFVYETSTEVLCNDTELECMSGQTLNFTIDRENRTTSNKKDPITQTESDKSPPNIRASHNFGTGKTFPDLNIISGNHDAKLETGMLYDTNKNDNISLYNVTKNLKIYVNPQEIRNKNPNFDKHFLNDTLIEVTSNNTGLENSTDPNSNLSFVEGSENIRNNKGVVKQRELDNPYASPTVSKSLKTENTFPERPKSSNNQDETSETEIEYQTNKNDNILSSTISSRIKLNAKVPEAEVQENKTATNVLSNIIELKNTTNQTLNLGGNGESDSTRDPARQTASSHAYVNSTVSNSIETANAIPETDKFSSNSKFKPKAEITQETNRDDNISFLSINSNATIYENANKPLLSYMNTGFPKSSLNNTLAKAFSNGTVLGNTTTQNINFSTNGNAGKIRNNVDIYELTELENSSVHSITLGKLNTDNKLIEMLNNLSSKHDNKLRGGIVNEPNNDFNSSLNLISATTTKAYLYSALKHNSDYDKSFVNETLVEDLSDSYEFEKMQKSNATGDINKNDKDLNYSAQSTLIANLKTQSVVTENPKVILDYGYKSLTNKTNVHENISLNNFTETSSLRKYLNDEEAETSTSPNVMNIHNVTGNFTPQMFKISNFEGDSSAYLYSSTTTKPSIKNITSVFTSIPEEGSMENKNLKIIKDLGNGTHSLSQISYITSDVKDPFKKIINNNHAPYKEIENNVTINVSERGIAKNGTKQTNNDREGNLINSRKKIMGNDLIHIKNYTEYILNISRFNDTFVNRIQKDERVEQFRFDNMNSVNKNKSHEKNLTVETHVNRTEIFNNSNSNYIEYVTQYDMELPISSDRPSVLKSMAPNVQLHDKNTEPTLEGLNSLNNASLIVNQTEENNTTSDVSLIKEYTPNYGKIKEHHIERTNSPNDEERFPVTLFGIKDAIQTTTARMTFINISSGNINNKHETNPVGIIVIQNPMQPQLQNISIGKHIQMISNRKVENNTVDDEHLIHAREKVNNNTGIAFDINNGVQLAAKFQEKAIFSNKALVFPNHTEENYSVDDVQIKCNNDSSSSVAEISLQPTLNPSVSTTERRIRITSKDPEMLINKGTVDITSSFNDTKAAEKNINSWNKVLNNSLVTGINPVGPTTAAKMLINKTSDLRGENGKLKNITDILKHKKLLDNNDTNTNFSNISEVTTVKSINDNDTKYDNTYTQNILVAAVDNNKTIKPSCFDGLCAESKEEKFFPSSLKSRNESILDDDALAPSNHNDLNIDRGIRILPNKKEPIKNNDDVNIFSSPDLIKIVTKFSINNFTINKDDTTVSNAKLKEPLSELRSPNEFNANVNYPNKSSSNLKYELTMVIETNNRTDEVNKVQLDYRSIKINSSNYAPSYNRSNVTSVLDYNKSNDNKTINVDEINNAGYTEINQGISLILKDEKNLLHEKNYYQKVLVNSRSKPSIPNFICRNNSRGRFADKIDCRRFYICIGNPIPILGLCPVNTVFSEIRKQCTRNLSHCIRNYQFKCVKEGRFSDVWHENIYYLCIKDANQEYVRFKFQCQNGFHLDKINVICHKVITTSKTSTSSSSTSSKDKDLKVNKETINKKPAKKSSNFRCEEEGKFIDPNNCKRYYVCSKTSKAILRRKRKKCDSDEIFDNDKSKCVDKDSHEC